MQRTLAADNPGTGPARQIGFFQRNVPGFVGIHTQLGRRTPPNRIHRFPESGCHVHQPRIVAENNPRLTARFFWQDLANEPPKEKYDLIIVNPPFHAAGQAAEPALGQAFIKTAAGALRSGGKLLMVANRGMPYEPVLAAEFRTSTEVCRNARFKIRSAQK